MFRETPNSRQNFFVVMTSDTTFFTNSGDQTEDVQNAELFENTKFIRSFYARLEQRRRTWSTPLPKEFKVFKLKRVPILLEGRYEYTLGKEVTKF